MIRPCLIGLVAFGALLASPAPGQAAQPEPFGHTCLAQNGVRFCPTARDAQRVPSFDGVPLDVDVTLPAEGDGPFPAIVLLHGFSGDKTSYQAGSAGDPGASAYHYNDAFYARRGYAVVTYSARGYGRSCGVPSSRTSPGCDRGWLHLADQRYEARDTQSLLGMLVDQGVVDPDAIGVSGVSYGAAQAQTLARLRDRIRLPNSSYRRWRSPAGRALRVRAAFARIGPSDFTYSLMPNGRLLDFQRSGWAQSVSPVGVKKESYVNTYRALAKATTYVAPGGADPTADLEGWTALIDRGEPYGADVLVAARELTRFHSPSGVSGPTAPLLVQNGWTDDLFPAAEALRTYRTLHGRKGARVSLQLGDLGHPRGSNKPNAERYFNDQAARFFDTHLKGAGRSTAHASVAAFTQTCPGSAPGPGRYRASSWRRLHPGAVRFGSGRDRRIASGGGSPATAEAIDPLGGGGACTELPHEPAQGTAHYREHVRSPFTLLGLPTVRARIRTRGRDGFIAARLWDVFGSEQRLVSRGVYRLRANQRGRVLFQLFGNGYRFERGHTVELELLGSDPGFLRSANDPFSVGVSELTAELPTHQRPGRWRGIKEPKLGDRR